MYHIARWLQATIVLIALSSGISYACESGYQQWHAAHDVVCLPNRMLAYLSCLESTGAGQIRVEKDNSGIGTQKFTVGIFGEGNGPFVHGKGKIRIDTSKTNSAIHQINQQFDPKNSTNCLTAAFDKDINETKRRSGLKQEVSRDESSKVVVKNLVSESDQHTHVKPVRPVKIEKIVQYPIVLRRDEPLPNIFDSIYSDSRLSDLKTKFPNGKLTDGCFLAPLEMIPFKDAAFFFTGENDDPSVDSVCLFYRDEQRDYPAIKEQAVAVFGMSPGVSRLAGTKLVWANIKESEIELTNSSYCVRRTKPYGINSSSK